MDKFKQWWAGHGTKALGFGGAFIGALEYVDAQTLQAINSVLGPKYGPMVSHGLTAIGGLLVAKRGFTNSKKKADVPPSA